MRRVFLSVLLVAIAIAAVAATASARNAKTTTTKIKVSRSRSRAARRGEASSRAELWCCPGDNRLPIIGGSGEFNGAAGKLKTHNLGKRKTLLTFIFVQ